MAPKTGSRAGVGTMAASTPTCTSACRLRQPPLRVPATAPCLPLPPQMAVHAVAAAEAPSSTTGQPYGRVFNFSAGPSMLAVDVLEQAQADLLNWRGSGALLLLGIAAAAAAAWHTAAAFLLCRCALRGAQRRPAATSGCAALHHASLAPLP